MQDIQDLMNMPSEQKKAIRDMFLTFVASLIVQSFFK